MIQAYGERGNTVAEYSDRLYSSISQEDAVECYTVNQGISWTFHSKAFAVSSFNQGITLTDAQAWIMAVVYCITPNNIKRNRGNPGRVPPLPLTVIIPQLRERRGF